MTTIQDITPIFETRLQTLRQLLLSAQKQKEAAMAEIMTARIIEDMHPLATQVAFACNQPNHFVQWCLDKEVVYLESPANLEEALETIDRSLALLTQLDNAPDLVLKAHKEIALPDNMRLSLSGTSYIRDFLMPNFYFHLVTAYNILRMQGINIGKQDYMRHLASHIQQKP
jgi:uncharacterized protein